MCSRPRKPQRKPKPSAAGALRFERERGIVEPQLLHRLAQPLVLARRRSGRARRRPSVWPRGSRGTARRRVAFLGQRVADLAVADLLDVGDDEADLADAEHVPLGRLGAERRPVLRLSYKPPVFIKRIRMPLCERAVDDTHEHHHAAVGVVPGVEDQRLGRMRHRTTRSGGGTSVTDRLEDLLDADALLGRGRDAGGRCRFR